jgi:(p)ppGpp synthase/HD superfamily hydrolase
MSTLERAIALAAASHAGQVDKAGAPYILHPLRVMLRQTGTDERIAAVLHDTVEDCGWTPERLRQEGFSAAVVAAVEALTKRPGEEYESAIRRAAADPIARAVKLADLADNSNLSRIANPTDEDRARVEKYRRAIALIRSLDAETG